jgi:DNA-binding protein H-NS
MDLSTLSVSQLRDLQQQIPAEIKRREAEEKINVLNELRAFAKTRGYAIEFAGQGRQGKDGYRQ